MLIPISVLFALVGCVFAYKDPHYHNNRSVIVHLFEWKWNDIALECERFLGPNGFAGVQVSPPSENAVIDNRPWYERYQPVSYKLITRSGNEREFADMVKKCNDVGVRIYVDAVVNHMTGVYSDGTTGGSVSQSAELKYPDVPYGPEDFNHPICSISDYTDVVQVRNCELVGLHDLNQTSEHVRKMIVEYFNHMIDLGIAGLRIDAAKHMWPEDLKIIYDRIKNLNTSFGYPQNARPYIFQEVIDLGGEGVSKYEYTPLAVVTEFRFGAEIGKAFRGGNKLKWFKNWGPEWSMVAQGDGLVFVDNHDNQRGHGAGGSDILTYKQGKQYRAAIGFTLAHTYGEPRVMSSYAFDDTSVGPPQDDNQNIISPQFDENGICTNGWVCEHRWQQIYQMVTFRNVAMGSAVNNWWDNGNNQIAFCRGNKAFIVFNNEDVDLDQSIQTCLPVGKYCDIISGRKQGNNCTGKTITVEDNGKARILITPHEYDMHIAIHVGEQSKL